MLKNEIKIKSAILNISEALNKKDFKKVSKIQSEIVHDLSSNEDYNNEFFKLYEITKNCSNKGFLNIMEEVVVKSKIYNREELAYKR